MAPPSQARPRGPAADNNNGLAPPQARSKPQAAEVGGGETAAAPGPAQDRPPTGSLLLLPLPPPASPAHSPTAEWAAPPLAPYIGRGRREGERRRREPAHAPGAALARPRLRAESRDLGATCACSLGRG